MLGVRNPVIAANIFIWPKAVNIGWRSQIESYTEPYVTHDAKLNMQKGSRGDRPVNRGSNALHNADRGVVLEKKNKNEHAQALVNEAGRKPDIKPACGISSRPQMEFRTGVARPRTKSR